MTSIRKFKGFELSLIKGLALSVGTQVSKRGRAAYNMKDKKIKAIGYIKAPTGRIKEANPNPEVQEEKIKVYAESEGLDLVRVYREKVLGCNIVNKDELDQIYKDISEGNADTILIYKGGRITRWWSINRLNKEEYQGSSEEI